MADTYYATGKRKSAVARVWLRPGQGNMQINEKDLDGYFGGLLVRKKLEQPLVLTETLEKYDVQATVRGGGKPPKPKHFGTGSPGPFWRSIPNFGCRSRRPVC